MDKKDNMERLRSLTDSLPPSMSAFDQSKEDRLVPDMKRLAIKKGTMLVWSLLDEHDVSVFRCFVTENSEMLVERREGQEVILIHTGEMKMNPPLKQIDIGGGKLVVLESNQEHILRWPCDTWFIVMSVPVKRRNSNAT